MKVEIPEFKRCCCCIPLRHGLLAIGYLKLLASLSCLGMIIYITVLVSRRFENILQILLVLVWILLVLIETSLTIVFLVGSHKKNHKLIRIYYYYSIVGICFYVFAFIVTMILEMIFGSQLINGVQYLEAKITTGVFNYLVQLYVVLLIRSEVMKLKNNVKFKFSNHAPAESQCQMESKDSENKNNITTNEPIKKVADSRTVHEKNALEENNNKNINVDSDEKFYLNKYIKMKNEE